MQPSTILIVSAQQLCAWGRGNGAGEAARALFCLFRARALHPRTAAARARVTRLCGPGAARNMNILIPPAALPGFSASIHHHSSFASRCPFFSSIFRLSSRAVDTFSCAFIIPLLGAAKAPNEREKRKRNQQLWWSAEKWGRAGDEARETGGVTAAFAPASPFIYSPKDSFTQGRIWNRRTDVSSIIPSIVETQSHRVWREKARGAVPTLSPGAGRAGTCTCNSSGLARPEWIGRARSRLSRNSCAIKGVFQRKSFIPARGPLLPSGRGLGRPLTASPRGLYAAGLSIRV